jgi:hypothetical protein
MEMKEERMTRMRMRKVRYCVPLRTVRKVRSALVCVLITHLETGAAIVARAGLHAN